MAIALPAAGVLVSKNQDQRNFAKEYCGEGCGSNITNKSYSKSTISDSERYNQEKEERKEQRKKPAPSSNQNTTTPATGNAKKCIPGIIGTACTCSNGKGGRVARNSNCTTYCTNCVYAVPTSKKTAEKKPTPSISKVLITPPMGRVPSYGCSEGNLGQSCKCPDGTKSSLFRDKSCNTYCNGCKIKEDIKAIPTVIPVVASNSIAGRQECQPYIGKCIPSGASKSCKSIASGTYSDCGNNQICCSAFRTSTSLEKPECYTGQKRCCTTPWGQSGFQECSVATGLWGSCTSPCGYGCASNGNCKTTLNVPTRIPTGNSNSVTAKIDQTKEYSNNKQVVTVNGGSAEIDVAMFLDKTGPYTYGKENTPNGVGSPQWNATEAIKRFGSVSMKPGDKIEFTKKVGFGDKLKVGEKNQGDGYVGFGNGACLSATVLGETFGTTIILPDGKRVPLYHVKSGYVQDHAVTDGNKQILETVYHGGGVGINQTNLGSLPFEINKSLPSNVKVNISLSYEDSNPNDPSKGVFKPKASVKIDGLPPGTKIEYRRLTSNRTEVLQEVTGNKNYWVVDQSEP